MLPEHDDKEWERLIAPETILSNQRKAEKKFERLTSDEVLYLQRRCKTDLFFLSHGILGYNRLSPQLHGSLCNWLSRTAENQYRMVLLPRAHFKTTVATVADSIQCALPDCGTVQQWPRGLGTNVRILYAHESHEGATRFLFETTRHFTNNPRLMGLFPELVPSPRIQRMNKFELELPRTEFWAEPTFDTIGVGGHSQGRHFNYIKLDDIFGDKARDSKAERESLIQWFDNIQSFLVRLKLDHMDVIGTRYSLDDVYAHAMRVYGNKMLKYIRRIKESDENDELKFIFPEEFDDDAVAVLKKNIKVWNAQYVNDPHEGLAEFDLNWKKYYHYVPGGQVAAFFGTQTIAPTKYKISDLDKIIIVDPAVSGKSGIVVTGTDNKMHVYVLEAIKGHLKPPELVQKVFELVQKYWPRLVAFEEVIFSANYKPWIETEMRVRGVRFNIVPVKPRKAGRADNSKMERVRALSNYFSAGQILFNEGQTDLIEEYDNFGATDDYHLLDALAYGPELWRNGLQASQMRKYQELEEELLEERDPVTGYSR